MEYVRQEHDCGCGAAVLAMVTGLPYGDVVTALAPRIADGNGINEDHVFEFLYRHGFAIQRLYKFPLAGARLKKREPWPPAPWAPAHIAQVTASAGYHFVVMDEAGRVLDPWKRERDTLAHPDYRDLHWVAGIWKVRHA